MRDNFCDLTNDVCPSNAKQGPNSSTGVVAVHVKNRKEFVGLCSIPPPPLAPCSNRSGSDDASKNRGVVMCYLGKDPRRAVGDKLFADRRRLFTHDEIMYMESGKEKCLLLTVSEIEHHEGLDGRLKSPDVYAPYAHPMALH
eukprot:Lankesteria_metandrocarpae@DN11210_c0_g1_i1.p1